MVAAKKKDSGPEPLISTERKQEILGLILIAFALLFSLALLTYSPEDNSLAQSFSLSQALNPGEAQAENWLGPVGALIAYALVPNFLGYVTLVFAILMAGWGYYTMRNYIPRALPLVTLLIAIAAFLSATLLGWIGHVADFDLIHFAGSVGLGLAGWMQQLFGSIGSLLLLALFLTVTLLMLVDHDVQRTLDRLVALFVAIRKGISERWANFKEERAARRAAIEKEAEQSDDESSAGETEKEEKSEGTSPPAKSTEPSTTETPEPVSEGEGASSAQRVNDLFKPGAKKQDQSNTSTSPPQPKTPEPAPSTQEKTDAKPEKPEPTPVAVDDEGPEMKVQGQVEEEKAEDITREAEVPQEERKFEPPSIDLLDEATDDDQKIDYDELKQNKQVLLDKLSTYNIEIQEINAIVGPTVTRYELLPAPGIKVSKIKSLEDDLAMAMAAQSIRVIAPIPGKRAVGVEIPNRNRELVRLRSVLGTAKFRDSKMALPIPMGKTIEGEVYIRDLSKMPHLLIAGATGSGKSVGLNALITGLLYACHPANLNFVIIDPKKIELQQYAMLEDHFLAFPEGVDETIITDFEQALGVLKSCEKEMEQRYDMLSRAGVRGIKAYNRRLRDGELEAEDGFEHMPYIVVVVDELADLMMTAGKDIEEPIARLAQMARAVGIHLVLATQRPSVDVITGLIKANFPSRIAYQVASRVDSRTILDQIGAEGLVGNGDMLYMSGSKLTRLQAPFVSIEEVERINEYIASQPKRGAYTLPSLEDAGATPQSIMGVEETDEKFEEAARIIVKRQQGSVSLLQRKMAIGYTRAARIVDQLEEAGIVGPFVGTKARDVLVEDIQELERLLAGEEEAEQEAENETR